MGEPLKRHSERVAYMRNAFLEAARGATSVDQLKPGRDYIWADLGEIVDENVRREARDRFKHTMQRAQILEERHPERVSGVIVQGICELIEFLEANDI